MPDEGLERDGAVEDEAIVSSSKDVAEDALGLFPVATSRRANEAAKKADGGRNIGASHVGAVQELAKERGEGKGLDVEGLVEGGVRGELGGHRRGSGGAGGHTKLLEDILDIL